LEMKGIVEENEKKKKKKRRLVLGFADGEEA
jgi:hypothetical protein